jgi:AcrR family transcriptional regulator
MEKQLSDKAVQTKSRITQAAKTLFIKKGYEATTLREIAQCANVTTGAFYKYYRSKDEILVAIFNDRYKEQWKLFCDLKDSFKLEDYIEMDAKMNKGLADAYGYELLKVYFSAQWSLEEQGSLWSILNVDEYVKYNQQLISKLVEKYPTKFTAEEVEDLILKADRGTFYDWILKKGRYDIGEASRQLLTIMFKGIFPDWTEE